MMETRERQSGGSEELSHLVSSTLAEDACPRVALGKACLVPDDFDCVCEEVDGASAEVVTDNDGVAIGLRLIMTLKRGRNPLDVERQVDLTGFKARHGGTNRVVECFFDYRMPQNIELKNAGSERAS